MVSNSTNLNKTNNPLSLQLINNKNKITENDVKNPCPVLE
jgi:hypothetical protein